LCKFESLYNHYSRSNIHDTNAFKDMEPKFWCLRHTRFHIKDMMICEMNCMMITLVVALSHETLYTYARRLTTIEALQQAQQGNQP
jgi:hypothetical protein